MADNKSIGVFGACCLGIIIIALIFGIFSGGSSSNNDYTSSDSSSSSSSELENVEYDPDSGIASATVECPNCGATAGVATDGDNGVFVCPECGMTVTI